jgi:hypothetical protein
LKLHFAATIFGNFFRDRLKLLNTIETDFFIT